MDWAILEDITDVLKLVEGPLDVEEVKGVFNTDDEVRVVTA